MSITGVFFIPSNPNAATAFATVNERLRSSFADEPVPVGRWALEHKLMRDTPSCLPASANPSQKPLQPRYMQFLSLSHYPDHGFVYTSESTEEHHRASKAPSAALGLQSDKSSMIMSTVPLASYNTLFGHFAFACQPFWCHRHTVTILGGIVYEIGDFRVRLGDVRQTQPAVRVRGTVVEIEWRGPSLIASIPSRTALTNVNTETDSDSGINVTPPFAVEEADIDAEYAAAATLIREFWAKLDIKGAREAILVPDVGKEIKQRLRQWKRKGSKRSREPQSAVDDPQDEDPDVDAGVDLARQLMEILRFNR
ncbi:hypothetical protein ASPZODRAFT_135570 [Penicilliopsis zonata CBS 506.65]|uniref:Mediator of RNA polymerase II transcription subunit 20 n=1 Tax=Penicilliopsis zonata CBS 506.65 TaxID=1073090 RepID=A0A1L9SA91_9EURO|nr:hypothetical protein ASPZODRAFT_135570 [Penicilliopsis zonata CBS 506.65]OJJ44100.1 hypothetical protein ASPZODRAFT_135570 [Penicilliopsis zonata CBS 506.65]